MSMSLDCSISVFIYLVVYIFYSRGSDKYQSCRLFAILYVYVFFYLKNKMDDAEATFAKIFVMLTITFFVIGMTIIIIIC